MVRKTNKNNKNKTSQYTALIPKTLNATKNIKNTTINKINYFFTNVKKSLKKITQKFDKKTARSIHSLTRRRNRK